MQAFEIEMATLFENARSIAAKQINHLAELSRNLAIFLSLNSVHKKLYTYLYNTLWHWMMKEE